MRETMKAMVLAAALLGSAPVFAQDAAKPAATDNDAAEEAFLKTYFKEKELKQIDVAEREYAAIVEKYPAAREVVARSLLGRARCLRSVKRDEESRALFARVAKEFADIADAAKEAADALRASDPPVSDGVAARVLRDLSYPAWREEAWKYGERGVPTLVTMLRDESPEMVYRAAETLARMDAKAGHDALLQALAAQSSTYPEQVRKAAMSGFSGLPFLRRLSETGDVELHEFALRRLVVGFEDAPAVDAAVSDPAILAKMLAFDAKSVGYGRLLVAALAHGGAARDSALARLRGDTVSVEAIRGLLDPPAPVLADAEALAAIAPLALTGARNLGQNSVSPKLTAAFLRHPESAVTGVKLAFAAKAPCADPEALVAAIAQHGVGEPITSSWTEWTLAEVLVAALGRDPQPKVLERLASAWPSHHEGNYQQKRLPAFLNTLIASGVTAEEPLLAFQKGLPPDENEYHHQFITAIRDTQRRWPRVGAWATKAFLLELTLPTETDVHNRAAEALLSWAATYPDNAGLAAHRDEIIAALGYGGSDHLISVLKRLGPDSAAALRAALASHPHRDVVVRALVAFGDTSVGPDVERLLRTAADEDTAETMAKAFVALRHDAAEPVLADVLAIEGGKFAGAVWEVMDDLGADVQRRLIRVALAKAPGAVAKRYGSSSNFSPLTQADRRAIVLEALASPSDDERAWAATQEQEVLDFEAWDRLLAAAQDGNYEVRDEARKALRAIRDKENEIDAFRAMGEERATRKRIEKLLASETAEQRRAGVAAIAATGLAGMVNELIRLAAEDHDDDVRDDARKALLAMAKAAPASPSRSEPAEKK